MECSPSGPDEIDCMPSCVRRALVGAHYYSQSAHADRVQRVSVED